MIEGPLPTYLSHPAVRAVMGALACLWAGQQASLRCSSLAVHCQSQAARGKNFAASTPAAYAQTRQYRPRCCHVSLPVPLPGHQREGAAGGVRILQPGSSGLCYRPRHPPWWTSVLLILSHVAPVGFQQQRRARVRMLEHAHALPYLNDCPTSPGGGRSGSVAAYSPVVVAPFGLRPATGPANSVPEKLGVRKRAQRAAPGPLLGEGAPRGTPGPGPAGVLPSRPSAGLQASRGAVHTSVRSLSCPATPQSGMRPSHSVRLTI